MNGHYTRSRIGTKFSIISRLKAPRSAVAVDDAIRDQVKQLLDFPESGRSGRINGTRELVVTGLPYLVAYGISGNVVRILRVLHHAQEWPDDIPH